MAIISYIQSRFKVPFGTAEKEYLKQRTTQDSIDTAWGKPNAPPKDAYAQLRKSLAPALLFGPKNKKNDPKTQKENGGGNRGRGGRGGGRGSRGGGRGTRGGGRGRGRGHSA